MFPEEVKLLFSAEGNWGRGATRRGFEYVTSALFDYSNSWVAILGFYAFMFEVFGVL
jgi:hypothetical protein